MSVLMIAASTEAQAVLDQPDTSAVDRGAVDCKEPETRVLINNVNCLAKTVFYLDRMWPLKFCRFWEKSRLTEAA